MPGRSAGSPLGRYVGLAAAIVGVVGFVAFGWRFGGATDGAIPVAVGVLAAVVAVGWTLRRRS